MRLINTTTIKLEEFPNTETPAYAILSHRWEEDEVTFQDLRSENHDQKRGWSKISKCCAKALQDGWQYVWIDCCCIDKTSSSELSESINSMFIWYRNAYVCYAYLSDVPGRHWDHENGQKSLFSALEQSKWFTRGWTLQELLAPEWVTFLANDWSELGTKAGLANLITSITGITHLFNFEEACVAQKMSWAASRQTERLEDRAYCMLGLFDVSMPLLYGEGTKAFIRLQLEIMNKTDDESIFAWTNPTPNEAPRPGLLAQTPDCFRDCGHVRRFIFDQHKSPHFMTNKGLHMEINHFRIHRFSKYFPAPLENGFVVPLDCAIENEKGNLRTIFLRLVPEGESFVRHGDPGLALGDWTPEDRKRRRKRVLNSISRLLFRTRCSLRPSTFGNRRMHLREVVHIKQSGHNDPVIDSNRLEKAFYTVSFDMSSILHLGYSLSESLIWPPNENLWAFWRWNIWRYTIEGHLTVTITSPAQVALVHFQTTSHNLVILVWFTSSRPWIAVTDEEWGSLEELAAYYDEHDWWPQSKNDPATFKDNIIVNISDEWCIDVNLYRAGMLYTSSSETYWVHADVRNRLEGSRKIKELVERSTDNGEGEGGVEEERVG